MVKTKEIFHDFDLVFHKLTSHNLPNKYSVHLIIRIYEEKEEFYFRNLKDMKIFIINNFPKEDKYLHYAHDLFISLETCRDELVRAEGLQILWSCFRVENQYERLIYRCKRAKCQRIEILLKNNRIPLRKYMFLCYLVFIRSSYNQIKLLMRFEMIQ